jgi:hypothetical protein
MIMIILMMDQYYNPGKGRAGQTAVGDTVFDSRSGKTGGVKME